MSNPELEQREFLASARRGLSPNAADEARVFASLERALASAAAAGAGSAPGAQATDSVVRPLLGRVGAGRLVTALALVGAATGGYYAGFRAGARSSSRTSNPVVAVAPVASVLAVASSAPSPLPASALARDESPVRAGEARRSEKPAARTEPSAAPVPVRSRSLEEEVRTLRRVERALRERNPRLALALLSDLDREVPEGQLSEERLAAQTMARCALGYGAPQVLANDFSERYPASAYVSRVQQVCESELNARPAQPEPEQSKK